MENQLRDIFNGNNTNETIQWQNLIRSTLNRVLDTEIPRSTSNANRPNTTETATENPVQQTTLNNSHSPNNGPSLGPTLTNRFVRSTDLNSMRSQINMRQLDVMNDFLYEYNRNIREYNKNIRDIIQMLNVDFTTGLSNNHYGSYTVDENNLRPDTNFENEDDDPVPRTNVPHRTNVPQQSNTVPNSMLSNDASILLSYYMYPINTQYNVNYNQNINSQDNADILTREEIASTTRTYGYTNELAMHTDSSANLCPISLDPFQVGDVICEIIGCGHIFKRFSLIRWLRRNSRCPVCRYQLRDYLNRQNNETTSNETDNSNNTINTEVPVINNSLPTISNTLPTISNTLPITTSPLSADMNSMMMRLVQSMMTSSENRHSTFDASGNEIYEFDIPINNLFAPITPNTTFDNNSTDADNTSTNPYADPE